jgi:hypothetical protein
VKEGRELFGTSPTPLLFLLFSAASLYSPIQVQSSPPPGREICSRAALASPQEASQSIAQANLQSFETSKSRSTGSRKIAESHPGVAGHQGIQVPSTLPSDLISLSLMFLSNQGHRCIAASVLIL